MRNVKVTQYTISVNGVSLLKIKKNWRLMWEFSYTSPLWLVAKLSQHQATNCQAIYYSQIFSHQIQCFCQLGWRCRIHQLHLCSGVGHPHNKCPGYDTKKSDCEVPVMLELWGMWGKSSLPLLPGPLWARVVAPDRTLSMGQIELNCILILKWIVWNRTVLDIQTVLHWIKLFEIELFWHIAVCKKNL